MAEEKSSQDGVAGLPKEWSVAVQLIGTFGLAVFLVLYYVVVMQPAESRRYDQLAASVNSLMDVVRERQSLLTREQSEKIEELYIQATGPALVHLLIEARERSRGEANIAREIENEMMMRVDLLRGLTREDGGVLSEQLTNKLRRTELPQRIAALATGEWRAMPEEELETQTFSALRFAIRAAARAK